MKLKGPILVVAATTIIVSIFAAQMLTKHAIMSSKVNAIDAVTTSNTVTTCSSSSSKAYSNPVVTAPIAQSTASSRVADEQQPKPELVEVFDSDHSSSSASSIKPQYSPSWSEFAKKMPKPYQASRHWEGIYTGDIAELEFKAKNGDLVAKWLYAQQVQVRLDHELNRQYPISSSIPPAQKMEWLKRYEPIRQLYSECAVEGSLGCVKGLIGTPYHPALRDEIDSLAWIFIIGGMTGRVEQALGYFCELEKLSCTDEAVAKGFERAGFYLEYYQFKLVSNRE